MKVFIAGATRVLGRRLVQRFRTGGDSVVGLVRSSEGEIAVRSLGAESRRGDLFDIDFLVRAADGADIIIHAATSIPKKTIPRLADWKMNDRIRRDGTRTLTMCAGRIGAKLYIQQSIVWVARPPDGSNFDENSPTYPDAVTLSAADSEKIAREAGERFGFHVSVLRCGWFYAPDAYHTRTMAELLMRRRMPLIGKGDNILSLLHADDTASAFFTVAEGNRSGLWHIVDDTPVTMTELLTYFAGQIGAPLPRRTPKWLARLIGGKEGVDFLTISSRTSNAKFHSDFGWTPQFGSFREGLENVIEAWRVEGFLLTDPKEP